MAASRFRVMVLLFVTCGFEAWVWVQGGYIAKVSVATTVLAKLVPCFRFQLMRRPRRLTKRLRKLLATLKASKQRCS